MSHRTEATSPGLARTLIPALVGVAAVSLAGWAFGLDPGPALLVGLTVVALFGLRHTPLTNRDEAWPVAPDTGSDHGVRREVARLSWSLQGYESRVERPSLVRLRRLTEHRLARHGLRLDDAAAAADCAALLGPLAYRTVTADARTHVTFAEFAGSLAAVERLGSDPIERTPS